jgi:hypothetical protein
MLYVQDGNILILRTEEERMNTETLTDINEETDVQMDKLKEFVEGQIIKIDLQLSNHRYSFFGEPITMGVVYKLLAQVISATVLLF